jgi:hypothetical protein
MNRREFPESVVTTVLVACRRRCALCVFLDGDASQQEGQIAHIDRNAANVKLENAAFLCTKHHGRYDATSRQTKGHTPAELRAYLELLHEYIAVGAPWPRGRGPSTRGPGVSLEVFDRRVPTYRKTMSFIRTMTTGGVPEFTGILQFAADTDEALFLFGSGVAAYLSALSKNAIRLHVLAGVIQQPAQRTRDLVDEHTQLMLWFTEQYAEARRQFAPHLYLGGGTRRLTMK